MTRANAIRCDQRGGGHTGGVDPGLATCTAWTTTSRGGCPVSPGFAKTHPSHRSSRPSLLMCQGAMQIFSRAPAANPSASAALTHTAPVLTAARLRAGLGKRSPLVTHRRPHPTLSRFGPNRQACRESSQQRHLSVCTSPRGQTLPGTPMSLACSRPRVGRRSICTCPTRPTGLRATRVRQGGGHRVTGVSGTRRRAPTLRRFLDGEVADEGEGAAKRLL